MGIFATTNILQENFNDSTVIPMLNYNESYFSLSLEYCKMINEEFDNANKTLYKCLLEAGDNYQVINESFDGFFAKIKEIVTKFIKFLKNLVDKFVTKFNQMIKSDKYIKKSEKLLGTFKDENEFDMNLFNFTFLSDTNIPQANAYTSFERQYNAFRAMIDPVSADSASVSIVGLEKNDDKLDVLRKAYRDIIDSGEDWFDEVRGAVIGERPISSSDYASELYKKFRDGENTTSPITINSAYVNNALLRFKTHDKCVKNTKEIQSKLTKDYDAIVKNVDRMMSSRDGKISLIGGPDNQKFEAPEKYTDEIIAELNMIAKAQSNRVQTMSTIHLQAMGAKLDAINASYKQDKNVLYKAINELQKWKNVKESTEDIAPTVIEFDRDNIMESVSSYESYMIMESYNQRMMNNYFTECMAIETKNAYVLQSISEGALDNIKDFITKIINKIKEFFGKVTEAISKTFKSDQGYLKQYKDIILNKKVTLGNLTDYYDIKTKELISNTPIPEFNYQSLKGDLVDEETFTKKYFGNIKKKADQSFGDAAKEYFLDGPKEKDSSTLNMTDLYNFCWAADETIKKFQTEVDKLSKAQGNALNVVDKFTRSSGSTTTSTTTTTNTNNQNKPKYPGTEPNPEPKEESMIYSSVYGDFISESTLLEVGFGNDKKDNKETTKTQDAPTKSADMSKNINAVQGRKDEDLSKAISSDNPEEVSKKVTLYFNVCSSFMMAKVSALQKAYKDYMDIIRAHVKSYAGDSEAKNKDHAAKTTNVTFEAPDEALKTLNQDQVQEYNTQREAARNAWKKYYGTFKGETYYSLSGNLPKKYEGKVTDENRSDIISKLKEKFLDSEEGKAYKEYWEKTFKDYNFPLEISNTEYENEPKEQK